MNYIFMNYRPANACFTGWREKPEPLQARLLC